MRRPQLSIQLLVGKKQGIVSLLEVSLFVYTGSRHYYYCRRHNNTRSSLFFLSNFCSILFNDQVVESRVTRKKSVI